MIKIAMAASLLITFLCIPTAGADETNKSIGDLSGFGGASLPSEPSNSQLPETGMQGDEPLSGPGASVRTGNQGNRNRNLPNLPQVTTAMPFKNSFEARGSLALQSQGLTKLQPARYAVLSEKDPITGALPDARYAILSDKAASKGTLPDARYAVLSEKDSAKFVAPPLSQVAGPVGSVLNIIRATEGF